MLCSSPDVGFFSSSKTENTGASAVSVTVRTRLAHTLSHPSFPPLVSSSQSAFRSSPSTNTQNKRKSPPVEPSSQNLPRAVKRLRALATRPDASRRAGSSSRTSRASSGRPSSPEPIYRSDRSRSTSIFSFAQSPFAKRRWASGEDFTPGNRHLSSELVVKNLVKSYKTCQYFFFSSSRKCSAAHRLYQPR